MSSVTTDGQTFQDWQDLLIRLEQLGFYKYADSEGMERAKAQAFNIGLLFGDDTKRAYLADEEDLAEGGVEALLREVRDFLEGQGVVIETLGQDFREDGYTVMVNGVTYLIHTGEEVQTEMLWALTTKRAFSMIDTLLSSVNSDERTHLLYGWNDGSIVFLTPGMYSLIKATNLLTNKEKPVSVEDMQ